MKKNIYALLVIVFFLMLDQTTKVAAQYLLKGQSDIRLLPNVLHLHYLENTGAAFSVLEGQTWFFVISTSILIVFFIYMLQHLSQEQEPRFQALRIILMPLIAGAAGNLLDRIANGYVIDFIYFVPIDFPVFNVADIYVTVSVFLLMVLFLFYYKEEDIDRLISALKIRTRRKQKNGSK